MKLEINLLENSYDFLNESLYYAGKADMGDETKAWKMAIINVVQSMELMFKECLRRVHPILVHENIDRISQTSVKTVSLSLAFERIINILKLDLSENEKRDINLAIKLRNEMMHYQFTLTHEEAKTKYAMMYKFLSSFHEKYFKSDLHSKINKTLWNVEENIIYFANNFVFYNGVEVTKEYIEDIKRCQHIKVYTIEGLPYQRIKYGEEHIHNSTYNVDLNSSLQVRICYDCSVKAGQYHVIGCDWEICPKCYRQVIACDCDIDEVVQYEQQE